MRGSIQIGRILGFPVELHLTFVLLLVLAAVFGGIQMAGLLVLVFASVLIHELGHSVVARRFGMPIMGITLLPFGGMARMAGQPTPRHELLIAAAGPATSIILGSFAAMGWILTGAGVLQVLASINFILGVFNLLPALPMDGGRMLRAWLAQSRGHLQATMVAGRLARLLSFALAISAVWIGPMVLVIAVLVWWMAGQEMVAAKARAWAADARRAQAHEPPGRGSIDAEFARMVDELRARAARPEPTPQSRPRGDVPASRVIIDVPPSK